MCKNLDEYFTKFIPSKLLNLFVVSLFIALLAKSSKYLEGNRGGGRGLALLPMQQSKMAYLIFQSLPHF